MSRRMVNLVLGAIVLGSLVACSGGDDSPPASEGGELSFSNWQWVVPDRGERLWEGARGYEQANPEATLEQVSTPFSDYPNKLNTELGAGEGPDVFVVLDTQFAELAEAGLVEPLDDVLDDADLNQTNAAAEVDGEQLGLTWERVNYALLWNRELLDEAGVAVPSTVDELIEVSRTIEEETGAQGFGVRHQMNDFEAWYPDFTNWVYGYGGAWSSDGALDLDSPENVDAVADFKKVYDAGIMPIGDDASTMRTKFQEGRLAMMIDNSGAALVDAGAGVLAGGNMGAAPMPFAEAGTHQQLILAVNANSDRKDLAKDFVAWVASSEGQQALRTGIGPSTMATDVPLDDGFASENPWADVFGPLAGGSQSTLVEGFETETTTVLRSFLTAVEDVLLNDTDPAEALAAAQQDASSEVGE